MRRLITILALAGALTACGVTGGSKSNVRGTGSGTDDFRKSPCACGPAIPTPNFNQRHA